MSPGVFGLVLSWCLVSALVSVNVCALNDVCDGDWGAAVLCTRVGIDYLSPQGAPERKMARFSISLISIIVLLHREPRMVLDMLLAMQSRIHCVRLYITLAACASRVHMLNGHALKRSRLFPYLEFLEMFRCMR